MEEVVSTEKPDYRWVILTCVFLINCLFNGFNLGTMAPLLPQIAEELKLTHTQIGTIWGALALGIMLFSVIGGNLADRVGVRRVITLALIAGAIFCAARALLPSFWGLAIAMFFLGVAQAFTIPNMTKVVGQWFSSAELGLANGILLVGAAMGAAIGSILGASVLSPVLGGWRGVMWLTGGVVIALVTMWAILAREQQLTKAGAGVSLQQPGFREGLRRALSIRDVWLLAITECCFVGGFLAWVGIFPDILVSKGMTAGAAGIFVSVALWTAGAGYILGPYASDRLGIRKLLIWPSLVVTAIGWTWQGFLMGAPLVGMIVLTGLAYGIALPIVRTVALEVEGVRPQLGGSAVGLLFMLNRLGAFTWPIVMGALIDHTDLYWPPLALLAVLNSIGVALVLFIKETGTKATNSTESRDRY